MADENWKEMFDSIWKREGNPFIQFLLDAGLDVNTLNKYGRTMLSYAAECGSLEIAESLVQKGADSHVANSDGSKPLHVAAQFGRKDIVNFLLDRGVPVDICDNNKSTPLHYVSKRHCIMSESDISIDGRQKYQEIVHILVDRGADLDAANGKNLTPVLLAAKNKCKHIVELLIELGANLECRDKFQITVLHRACYEEWLGIVKSLVHKGCDLNAKDFRGRTPFEWAVCSVSTSVVAYLIECMEDMETESYYSGQELLLHACREGWLDVVKSLTKKGYVNTQDANDNTPLHMAVCSEKIEVVEHLLKAGSDFNVKNNLGYTPFNMVIEAFAQTSILQSASPIFFNLLNNINTPVTLEGITLFLQNGAYFQTEDYDFVSNDSLLKEGILQNTQLCTLAVINEFNNADLPKVYKIPGISEMLPKIEHLKIASQSNEAQGIKNAIRYEIETEGYCKVLNVHPILLKRLCVLTLVEYYKNECCNLDDSEAENVLRT